MTADSHPMKMPLASQTSFGIGGVAADTLELPCDVASISAAVPRLAESEWFMLGGGTNVLVADSGYSGTIVRFAQPSRIEPLGRGRYSVSANASLDSVVSQTSRAGHYGVERLAGIPGSIGGAIVQNAGAYYQELHGALESVVCVDCVSGTPETFSAAECQMSYRDSRFKREPGARIIVECTLQLNDDWHPRRELQELRRELDQQGHAYEHAPSGAVAEAVRAIRGRKDHLLGKDNPSAGSFFKNPQYPFDHPTVQALEEKYNRRRDRLIEAGAEWISSKAKVVRVLDDGVELVASLLIATASDLSDPAHAYRPGRRFEALRLGAGGANTIVNIGGASAVEVVALAGEMRRAVSRTYGVTLDHEVALVGDLSLE